MRSPVQSRVPLLKIKHLRRLVGAFFVSKSLKIYRFYHSYVSRYVSKIIMLTTSVEAICFNYRPKKDNTYPIMLRLTKSGKRKYVSLGVSVKEEHWDFKKNTPKRNCPDRDFILAIIEKRVAEYRARINEYRLENKDYTLETLPDFIIASPKSEI